ncbi:transglycosylase SLT domain-containing protein [Denitratisoma oestradiolicum]|nr:transglycosylase SLT domain-containing protein [Denitratisoma oestradiolicum]
MGTLSARLHAEMVARESSLQMSPTLALPNASPFEVAPAVPARSTVEEDLPRIATIDLTAPPTDIWQRMRNGFSMPDLNSPLVAERQAWYLNRPQMLQQILHRSRRYIYFIVQELEKRGMPTELALLPMVESAFNPLAYSSARALGMWQFIPSTGKTYNLEQNWWGDQRRDIVASTGAALDYLQKIYEMHGDWHLALASYNWGENAVARAVARNQARGLPTDYQSLTMPGETRYYVPKLQALKNIIAHPELFGLQLPPVANEPYFTTIDMPATMDVAMAARLAEIPLDEFIALNPAHSRPVMRDTGSTTLVLPAEKVTIFQNNLERYASEDRPLSLWSTHVLKKGEKLETIAARHGITVAHLKQINSIGRRTKISTGQKLLVPDPSAHTGSDLIAKLPQTPADTPRAKGRGKGKKSASVRGSRTGKGRKATAMGKSGRVSAPAGKKRKKR